MIDMDQRVRSFRFPVRLVKSWGKVENAGSLLREKTLQITTAEPDCLTMENGAEGTESTVLLDFGREINGALRILTFRCGETGFAPVHVTFGESVAEALSELGHKNATNDHAIRDFDLCLPRYSDISTGESGFRFVCIRLKGANTRLQLKAVVAVAIFRDLAYRGSFRCDNDRLNQIFDTCAYTCHQCIQNLVIEGIKRDRLVWVGDMHPELLTIRSVFGNISAFTETIRFTRESTPLPGWMNGFPTYSLWWLILVYDWYFYNGDADFLAENREYVLGLTAQILSCVADDGTDTLPGYFLDWPCHEKSQEITGSRALLVMGLKAGEKLALLYHQPETANQCREKYGVLLSTEAHSHGAKQVTAMLALAGWYDPETAAAEILERGAAGWSTFMSYYLLKVAACGSMDETLKALETYYGGMLELGATTFWEDFDLNWMENASPIDEPVPAGKRDIHGDCGAYCYTGYRHSLCHGWSSAPAAFLLEEVAGIKIVEPGCRVLEISPNLGGLSWVEGTYPTPLGRLNVSIWRSEKEKTPVEWSFRWDGAEQGDIIATPTEKGVRLQFGEPKTTTRTDDKY